MVYGLSGRRGIYEVQEMIKILGSNITDVHEKLALAKQILASLPETHPIKQGGINIKDSSDSELYDLFCHFKDKAYSVYDVYQEFKIGAGFKHIKFLMTQNDTLSYSTKETLELSRRIGQLKDELEKTRLYELFFCNQDKHIFYAYKGDNLPMLEFDDEKICVINPEVKRFIESSNKMQNLEKIQLSFGNLSFTNFTFPRSTTKYLLSVIDNRRTVKEILNQANEESGYSHALLKKDLNIIMKQLFDANLGGMTNFPLSNA